MAFHAEHASLFGDIVSHEYLMKSMLLVKEERDWYSG
jgi:hypothetical protein